MSRVPVQVGEKATARAKAKALNEKDAKFRRKVRKGKQRQIRVPIKRGGLCAGISVVAGPSTSPLRGFAQDDRSLGN